MKLSICIATLNRADFLGATLDSIIENLPSDVEIVIVDGASTDGTPELVARYQQRCASIRYFRQERNGGVDRDYDAAVQYSTGEYCFLFTDDDVLKPGAVQRVLAALETRPSALIVNAEVRTADLREIVQQARCTIGSDREYAPADAERMFVELADYLSFIGGVIVRRDLWLRRDRQSYFGTLFIHVGVLFQEALPGTVKFLAEPLIEIRYGNAMWTARGFEIWMFKWPELIWSLPFSGAARRSVVPREPWRNLVNLARFRALGGYGPAEYERWIRSRRRSLPAWLVARIPGTFANAAIALVARVLRGPRSTTSIDLRNSPFYWARAMRQNTPR